MQAGQTATRKSLSGELEGDIDDAFPIDWSAGCVSSWRKPGSLYGADSGFAESVAQVTRDAKDVDRTGRRDAKAN